MYTVPAVVRKVLKITKLTEVMQITTTRKEKLLDHFDNNVFKKSFFEDFKDKVVITF